MTSAPARLTKPTSSASINSTTHATRIRRLVVAMMRYLFRDDHPSDGLVISTKSSRVGSIQKPRREQVDAHQADTEGYDERPRDGTEPHLQEITGRENAQ